VTVDELRDVVTSLELADDTVDAIALLEQVIDDAESLLAGAEADGRAQDVAEIARELQRAFESVAERSEPATRTRLLVGASFWSLRAASADIEDIASADYRSVLMLAAAPSSDTTTFDLASPAKTTLNATNDAPPVPGLLTSTNPAGASDATDLPPPPGLAPGNDAAAPSGDSQTATGALTP